VTFIDMFAGYALLMWR